MHDGMSDHSDFLVNSDKQFEKIEPESILIASTKEQLNMGGRIGLLLREVWDSSTNVAVISKILDIRPIAFIATFRELEYDESRYANIMLDAYNL